LVSLTAFAQELQIGASYQDVLKSFGQPLYSTKTEEGNHVWVYSHPDPDSSFLIEFNEEGTSAKGEAMTQEQILDFKEERGCGPLIGDEEWFSLTQEAKVEAVRGFIQSAREDNIILKQSLEYYVKEVDIVLSGPHNSDKTPVGIAIRIIAVMDGDWDDGSGNKLAIAHKYLGTGLLKKMRELDNEKYENLLDEAE